MLNSKKRINNNMEIKTTNLSMRYYPKNNPRKAKYKVVNNKLILQMYDEYEKWFDEVKTKGLKNVRSPLSNSKFEWN